MLQFDKKNESMTEVEYAAYVQKVENETLAAYDCFKGSSENQVPIKTIREWLEQIAMIHRATVDTEAYLKSKKIEMPTYLLSLASNTKDSKRMIAIISHNLMKVS